MPSRVWAGITLSILILRSPAARRRSRQNQAVVELALRQPRAIYNRRHPRPRIARIDRAFWVALSRSGPHGKSVLGIVQARDGGPMAPAPLPGRWALDLNPGPRKTFDLGRDPSSLIVRMATENRGRARKIQAERSKLGIRVSLATISRYLPKASPDPGNPQRWTAFLRNPRDRIAGMDFFVVPPVRFPLLSVWFAIDPGRRRVLHFNVTESPTASWGIQPLRHAFPNAPTHRFLILVHDAIFSPPVAASVRRLGLVPKRTAFQRPWQNGIAERFVGRVRRELLDPVVVLGENHLRRLLRESVDSYNAERVPIVTGDAPAGRAPDPRPSPDVEVVALPRVGGLHPRYAWRDAA